MRVRTIGRSLTLSLALLCVHHASAQTSAEARQHALKADAALKAGKPAEAIPEFEALLKLDPHNLDAQANLGVLLYFNARFAPAAEHLRAALAIQPGLAKPQGLLGLSEKNLGQAEPARTDLEAALPSLTEPKFRKQVGLSLIELESAAQDFAAATATAQTLRDKAPDDPEILYACYRTATDLAGASLLNLSLAAPQSGQMQMAIAHELLRVRDVSGAIASFRRAIAADPTLPGVHFELAEALHASPEKADQAQAASEYRLALKANPNDLAAKVRLADLLTESGDRDAAGKLYADVLTADPANQAALVGQAYLLSETGQDAAAALLLERAVAADPTDMLAHFRLASVYRKLHRTDDAKRELDIYTRLKQVKANLQQTYSTMKIAAPGTTADGGMTQ